MKNEIYIADISKLNPKIVSTKRGLEKQNQRLKVLLYNAIVLLEQDCDSIESVINELGMTSEEYDKIMFGEE